MTSSLPYLSITEARAAFKSKSVSPLELTQAYLERIETLNAKLNAFLEIRAETALSEARAATEAMARGEDRGPLHGIPLALKDLFDVRGMHTTAGSPILKDNLAAEDAFVTRRLRAAGAVFLGKLNMHEWALGVTSINPHFGACHNPWNTDVITGGSSGGSAAALAAGLCVASLGSDTGGSIPISSSLCGGVGVKPTYGRVRVGGGVRVSLLPGRAFAFVVALWWLRTRALRRRTVTAVPTWACGYARATPRAQYSASSFAAPLLVMFGSLSGTRIESRPGAFETHPANVVLDRAVVPLWRALKTASDRLHGLERSRIQLYLLYLVAAVSLLLIYLAAWGSP